MPTNDIPHVATVTFNVKGADQLFLDHLDHTELSEADRAMWRTAGVDIAQRPFGRVRYFVPLAEDGLNRHSLRANPSADIPGYSSTHPFALGIRDLWPHLGLFFDDRSNPAASLLAE